MHVPASSVASHLGTTSRSYFYFTTATLAVCLVFAVATIMVLVVQRTDSISSPPDNSPLKGGNCSEDILCMLKRAPFKKSWAYVQGSSKRDQKWKGWNEPSIKGNSGARPGPSSKFMLENGERELQQDNLTRRSTLPEGPSWQDSSTRSRYILIGPAH
ncbi:tumor necrosis factor ligand superfamily member 8 [Trichechus inunguis]